MSKFILAISNSVVRSNAKGYSLDAAIDFSAGGFDGTEVFDTEEQATNAWKVRRAQLKDLYISGGWEITTDDEDNEAWSLRVARERGGRKVERLYVAYIVRV